jgi:hypothetical protein
MKIRNGFVSNSSSSSFVVRAVEAIYKPIRKGDSSSSFGDSSSSFAGWKSLLTKKQIAKLKQYGFRRTWAHSPSQVPYTREEWDKHEAALIKKKDGHFSYGYDITCNQDEVIQFLLENKIPFLADEHYGHRSMFYDGKDKVVVAINFGTIMSMYGVEEKMDTSNPIQTFTRKQYLKKVTWP